MHILVTGGAGFIGSHLVKRFLQEGHKVCVIDNLSTGLRGNLQPQAELIEMDLSHPNFIAQFPNDKFDAVCHLAAQSSGELSSKDPIHDMRVNAESTLILSRWCLQNGIRRFLYASSMAVYGDQPRAPIAEDAACVPLSFYGLSKLASEHILRLSQREGLSSTSFRMFSVYGPGQNMENLKQGMVSIYLAYLLKGRPIPVTGSLERFRDFIYIDDVVEAWMRALAQSSTPSLIYNLGTGRRTTVRELLEILKETCDSPQHPVKELPGAPSDQFGLTAETSRTKKELHWESNTRLKDGIRRMVEWAKKLV